MRPRGAIPARWASGDPTRSRRQHAIRRGSGSPRVVGIGDKSTPGEARSIDLESRAHDSRERCGRVYPDQLDYSTPEVLAKPIQRPTETRTATYS